MKGYYAVILLMFACVCLQFLLPLVPAILLYRIFPDGKVTTSGVLSGVTFKASGAFAGYVVLLAFIWAPANEIMNSLRGQLRPTWSLIAHFQAIGQDGEPLDSVEFHVTLPESYKTESDQLTLPIAQREGRWPLVQVAAFEEESGKELGHLSVDLNNPGNLVVNVDDASNQIEVEGVQIRRFAAHYGGGAYQPTRQLDEIPPPPNASPGMEPVQ